MTEESFVGEGKLKLIVTDNNRADDEEKQKHSDFNLRIYSLQKLISASPLKARCFPVYEDQLKLLCLENALKIGQIRDPSKQGVEIAKMWHVMSVSLGDLNSNKIALWSKHPLGWTLA